MSYHDIDDWAEENIPPEMYDSFDEWITEIERNFGRHGHYFPPSMVKELADLWEDKFDIDIPQSEIDKEESIATEKTLGFEEQYLRRRLASKQRKQEAYYKKRQRLQSKRPNKSQYKSKRAKRRQRGKQK